MGHTAKESLLRIAQETARSIRKRTHIPGWHEDESRFPESDFSDIASMLERAYSLGAESAREKHKALIEEIIGQAEWSGCSDRGTMESLMGIFEPEELVNLGYGERVKAYLEEYGADGDWEEVSRKAAGHEAV